MPGIPFTKDDPRINREGRPVGTRNFTTKVREALEKIAEGKDYTYEEAFIKSILKKGIVDGDAATQRLIWNYLDGMPHQSTEVDMKGSLIVQFDKAFNKDAQPTPGTGESSEVTSEVQDNQSRS